MPPGIPYLIINDDIKLNKTHNKIHEPVSIRKGHVCLYTLIMWMYYILLLVNQINKCICSSYTHNLKIGIENLKPYRMYSVKFICEWIRKFQTLEVSEPSTHFVHLCIVQHFKSSVLTCYVLWAMKLGKCQFMIIFFKKHQWKSWLFFYFCICWLAESFLAPIRLVRGHGGTFVPLICQILATLGPTSSLSYIIYDRSWSWQFLNKEVASDFKYTWSIYTYFGESQIIHENWGM